MCVSMSRLVVRSHEARLTDVVTGGLLAVTAETKLQTGLRIKAAPGGSLAKGVEGTQKGLGGC